MKQKAAVKKRSHLGPGKVLAVLYVDRTFKNKMAKRAAELKMPLSKYLLHLASKDMEAGGNFTITPSGQG